MVIRFHQIIATVLLLIFGTIARAELSASVNNTEVFDGDVITLTVTLSNQDANGDLDISPLRQHFTVLGQKQSRNVSIINGQRNEETRWIINILPNGGSSALIPPLSLGKHKTKPISITIKPAPKNQSVPTTDSVFINSKIDRDQVYVGGQVILTVSVTHRGNLIGASLSEPDITGATVEKVHEASFQRQINNTPVIVIEQRYAIFPEQAGDLTIAPQLLQAELNIGGQRGLFGLSNSQTVHRRTDAIIFRALAIPDYARSKDAITANGLDIQQAWSSDPNKLQVGDSITRTLTITANGAKAAQIPPVWSDNIATVKQYRDQPKLDDATSINGVQGSRTESIAYVLTAPGVFEIAAVSLHWLDAQSGKVQSVSLPSTQLRVAAAPSAATQSGLDSISQTPSSGAQNTGEVLPAKGTPTAFHQNVWFWLSCLQGILWLFTVVYLLNKQGPKAVAKTPTAPDQSIQFKQLISACKRNDAATALNLFNVWGRQLADGLVSNADICNMLNNAEISKSIQRAEKVLYAKPADSDAGWSGTHLAFHLEAFVKQSAKASNQKRLAPLYS